MVEDSNRTWELYIRNNLLHEDPLKLEIVNLLETILPILLRLLLRYVRPILQNISSYKC